MTWILRDNVNMKELKIGDRVDCIRFGKARIAGMSPPRHFGSSGKIRVNLDDSKWGGQREFYPGVAGAEFIEVEDPKNEEGPRSISDIAYEIQRDWSKQGKGVNYAAKPYLEAMKKLDTMKDLYGAEPADMVVVYFLSNAKSWRGEVARRVKKELKGML